MYANDDSSYLGKWLLCRLMRKEGYSGTDIAKHMKHARTEDEILKEVRHVRDEIKDWIENDHPRSFITQQGESSLKTYV